MSKKLQPTNDRILIKPIDEGEQTYGSIVIPDLGKDTSICTSDSLVLIPKIEGEAKTFYWNSVATK